MHVVYEDLIEDNIKRSIMDLNLNGFNVHKCNRCNAHLPDLDIQYNNFSHLFEIKSNWITQMGGTSIKGNKDNWNVVNEKYWSITKEKILEETKNKQQDIEQAIQFFNKKNLPFTCEKSLWKEAVNQKILMSLNNKTSYNEKFITDHYSNNGVEYIEIGGLGLYYLNNNPLNLDIPQFKCSTKIEFRLSRSGSAKDKNNKEMVSVSYRVQARLSEKPNKSPLSLDNVEDCKKLIIKIVKQ